MSVFTNSTLCGGEGGTTPVTWSLEEAAYEVSLSVEELRAAAARFKMPIASDRILEEHLQMLFERLRQEKLALATDDLYAESKAEMPTPARRRIIPWRKILAIAVFILLFEATVFYITVVTMR